MPQLPNLVVPSRWEGLGTLSPLSITETLANRVHVWRHEEDSEHCFPSMLHRSVMQQFENMQFTLPPLVAGV